MMKKIVLASLAVILLTSTASASELRIGDKAQIKDGGWVCRTLDKAIASRIISVSIDQGLNPDTYQLSNGSCITYSIRPMKIVAFDDYLIPGFPEKGKLFVSLVEPRSGETWYAFTGFLQPVK
ncbi:TPA: hypothetical protein ACPZHR_004147 [Yersinia enterocolitica]